MGYRILFSNIGYARGIDGSLWQHLTRIGRHFYTSEAVQGDVLGQLKTLIRNKEPDLCCLVEIDQGSIHTGYLNQILQLMDDDYQHHDIAGKYGEGRLVGQLPFHIGKSNAFIARQPLPFARMAFSTGSKRLVYKIDITPDFIPALRSGISRITVFFAHFSLNASARQRQLLEMKAMAAQCSNPVVILADFNILTGFGELEPLITGTDLVVLNDEAQPTFTLHRHNWALDLCICSTALVDHIDLDILPQAYSDHAALLVHLH